MTGPGIPQTQTLFQQSGWLVVSILFIVFAIISTFCSLFIVEAMQAIPGNKHFQGTVEFGTIIGFYFDPYVSFAGQVCLYGTFVSNVVASAALSTQTLDSIFIMVFGRTCGALGGAGEGFMWSCAYNFDELNNLYNAKYPITYGFLALLIVVLPISLKPMTENIKWQIGQHGLKSDQLPTIGISGGYEGLVGIILLNFAFVSSVPSWINVKKNDVSVQKTLWFTTLLSTFCYIFIGIIPALSWTIPAGANLITVMLQSNGVWNSLFAISFSVSVLLPSIPVFLIMASNNLRQNTKYHPYLVLFLTHILPWFVVVPILSGSNLRYFIIWTSLIFVSITNFIAPLAIYLKACSFRKRYNEFRELTDRQKSLLKIIHSESKTINNFIDNYNLITSQMRITANVETKSIFKDDQLLFDGVEGNSDAEIAGKTYHPTGSTLNVPNRISAVRHSRSVNSGQGEISRSSIQSSVVIIDQENSSVDAGTQRAQQRVSLFANSYQQSFFSSSMTSNKFENERNGGEESEDNIHASAARYSSMRSNRASRREGQCVGFQDGESSELRHETLGEIISMIEPYLLEDVPDPDKDDEEASKCSYVVMGQKTIDGTVPLIDAAPDILFSKQSKSAHHSRSGTVSALQHSRSVTGLLQPNPARYSRPSSFESADSSALRRSSLFTSHVRNSFSSSMRSSRFMSRPSGENAGEGNSQHRQTLALTSSHESAADMVIISASTEHEKRLSSYEITKTKHGLNILDQKPNNNDESHSFDNIKRTALDSNQNNSTNTKTLKHSQSDQNFRPNAMFHVGGIAMSRSRMSSARSRRSDHSHHSDRSRQGALTDFLRLPSVESIQSDSEGEARAEQEISTVVSTSTNNQTAENEGLPIIVAEGDNFGRGRSASSQDMLHDTGCTELGSKSHVLHTSAVGGQEAVRSRTDNDDFENLPPALLMIRSNSFPMHPEYLSPAFRSVPRWFPLTSKRIAWMCLFLTCSICTMNLVYNLMGLVTSHSA